MNMTQMQCFHLHLEAVPELTKKIKMHNITYQRVLGDNTTTGWHHCTGHWQTKYQTLDYESARQKAAQDAAQPRKF